VKTVDLWFLKDRLRCFRCVKSLQLWWKSRSWF